MLTMLNFLYKSGWAFCLVSLILLNGCGTARFKDTATLKEFQASNTEQQSLDSKKNKIEIMPLSIENSLTGDDYLLGAGDLLTVTVFETEELNTEVRVSARGEINLPLLGDIVVLNLSAAEAEQKIEDLYRENYLHDPHVAVYIKEHVSRQITIIGAVEKPGTFDHVSQRRLLDVLAIAGGLNKEAASTAYLTRKDPRTGKTSNYYLDLLDLTKNGNMEQNHIVLGGDVIFIPKSGQCFIDGAVRKPGTYKIEGKMTIAEAIVLAGGLASYADDDSIQLVRVVDKGKKRQVVTLSYEDLQEGMGDSLVLKDQDIVYVESSALGKLFSGVGISLKVLGTGFDYSDPSQ